MLCHYFVKGLFRFPGVQISVDYIAPDFFRWDGIVIVLGWV